MSLQIKNDVFKNLIENYPNWELFREFIESDEGGLFRIADVSNNLCLIRYEKGISKMDLPHSRWFRSVVWNKTLNRPVCIAPSKTSHTDFNFTTFDDIQKSGIICQELLDGFMINCFKMIDDNEIYITSRSKLNAAGKFYSDKSFRELFLEAFMNTKGCPFYSENIIQNNTEEIHSPDKSKGELAVFYSFLVQHTEHRIVKKIEQNHIYAIHRGIVYEDGHVFIEDSPELFEGKATLKSIKMDSKFAKGSYAQIAARVPDNDESMNEVQKWIKQYLLDNDWQFQGLVFKDNLGNRWRFRSEKYSMVKALRGNTSSIRDRFSQLYTQNLLHKYTEYYQDDMFAMTIHIMFMNAIIKTVYDNYVDLHITKRKIASDIDKLYLPHLYNIHGIYLSQLKQNGKKVTIDEITQYFHKQPWQRISFLIKKNIDNYNSS